MDGLPVIIRLIDPPLHEFLPSKDELLVEVTKMRVKAERLAKKGKKKKAGQAGAKPSWPRKRSCCRPSRTWKKSTP